MRPTECISSAPTGRIFVKFNIRDFHYNPRKNSKFDENQAKIWGPLYELSSFIFAGEIIPPQKGSFGVKWHQAIRVDEGAKILRERTTTLRYTCLAYLA
jgi:hypothetical protein